MIDMLVKATALLAVVAIAAYALRRSSAALRHLLWTLGIVGLVALPVFATLLPFRLPVLPSRAVPQGDRAQPSDLTPSPTPSPTPSITAETVRREARTTGPGPVENATTPAETPIPWTRLIVGVWFAVLAGLLTRFVVGSVIVSRIARRAVPIDDPTWKSMAERAARVLDVTGRVDLRRSDEVAMPFACGLINPVVVIPSSADEWDGERREAVLMHELAHISRGDLAMNMLSHVVRSVYWFHPLAWLASHRLRVEGERACDDAVLRAGALPSNYAEHLLSIVRTVGTPIPTAAVAMARRSEFEGRLLAILEPGLPRGRMTRWHAAGLAALFLMAVMPLAAMSPAEGATAKSAAEASATEESATEENAMATNATAKSAAERSAAMLQAAPAQPSQAPGSAVGALIETLTDASANVRIAAAQSLGSLGDPRAIAALAKALKEDSDARVREAAAHSLGEIDDVRAVPPLLDALKTEKVASVKEQIVHSLGEIDDPSAVSGIIALVKDPSVQVRRAVAQALGELEDASAVPALLSMARDEDVEVRRQTASALSNFENPEAIDPLIAMAKDSDAEVRQQSISALSDFDDARLLPTFVAALKDANADVRHQAAHAIGNIDELKRAPGALIEALGDQNKEVRQAAANALGSIGDEAAVPALKRVTSDSDVEVRRAAAEALSEIGGVEAIQALMGLLRDQDPEIRKVAAEALGKRRGE